MTFSDVPVRRPVSTKNRRDHEHRARVFITIKFRETVIQKTSRVCVNLWVFQLWTLRTFELLQLNFSDTIKLNTDSVILITHYRNKKIIILISFNFSPKFIPLIYFSTQFLQIIIQIIRQVIVLYLTRTTY